MIDDPNEEDAPDFKDYSKKLSQIIINSTPRFKLVFLVAGERVANHSYADDKKRIDK